MKAKVLIPVLLLGAVGGVLVYFLTSADAAQQPTTTRLVKVEKGALTETASANGTIVPVRQVDVKSRTSGEVVEVLVAEGQEVAEGELLFRIDSIEAERNVAKSKAALERLQAQLAQARASLTIARYQAAEARVTGDLDAQGVELGVVAPDQKRSSTNQARIAAATVQQRLADIAAMEAQIKSAELEVQVTELNLSYTRIVAPFSGTVLALGIEKGTMVASGITNVSGGTAALTLANLADLRVTGQLDEAQIAKVNKGQDVEIRVDAYPDRKFTGVVEAVAPLGKTVANVVSFEVEIRVTDQDKGLLRSGMSADVEIVTQRIDDALFVPLTAIVTKGPARFVRLPDGSDKKIKTGATDGSRIVVLEGLTEGEQIQAIGASARTNNTTQSRGGAFPMGGGRRM